MASDNISQHPKLLGRTDLLNAIAESGRRLPGRQSKMLGFEVSWKSEDSPWRTGQRTATSTRLDTRVPNGSLVEDTNCRGGFWMRSKVANWRRWSCQITHLSSVDECHGYGARRAFETMDTGHRLRPAVVAGVRASAHTQEIVNAESREKNSTDARTALVTHPCPGIVVRKEKNNVFVSYRGRVTKVAPECLRKASVVEQMSWDITTKEQVLFEKMPSMRKIFRGKNPCPINLVNFLTRRCQTRRWNRRTWKRRSIHP